MCCGRISESVAGCMFLSAPSDGTVLSNCSDSSSFILCSATSKPSLLHKSTLGRLLCCSVSSPWESRLIRLLFRFFCVPCSDEWERVQESLTRSPKQSAHPLVPPGPTHCWESCLSRWLHTGVHRGPPLWTPMFLSKCLIRADTQGLLWGSWLRQTSRSWTAVWGRSWWTRLMKVSRFCLNNVGKRHTRGLLEEMRKWVRHGRLKTPGFLKTPLAIT